VNKTGIRPRAMNARRWQWLIPFHHSGNLQEQQDKWPATHTPESR